MTTPDNRPHTEHDYDAETPNLPAVIEVSQSEIAPSSIPPSAVSKAGKIAMVSAVIGTLLVATAERTGPKTPRALRVIERDESSGHGGADSDPRKKSFGGPGGPDPEFCGRDPQKLYPNPQAVYGIDEKHVQEGSSDQFPCEFSEDGEGQDIVTGYEIVDGEKTRVCFFTPVWAPDTAMRLAGTIEHSDQVPGDIHLHDGLLEIRNGILDASEVKERKVLVQGEASLVVTSKGRVSVTILPTDQVSEKGKPMVHVLVSAQEGDATIVQEGRDKEIVIKECEDRKIPLNVEQLSGGCYIAQGVPDGDGFSSDGAKFIILAGAAFLALRRRREN